jgi:hypothetical protein
MFTIIQVSAISWSADAGVSEFVELTDTPSTYFDQGNKCVTVKNDETGLEFISCDIGGGNETNLSELADVNVAGVQDNDVLKWDSALQKWIDASLESFGLFVLRAGDTMTGNLDMSANNITNIAQLQAPDGSAIKLGDSGIFTDIDQAINLQTNQTIGPGVISHVLTDLQGEKVIEAWQSGKNGSWGYHRNSYGIFPDFGITNGSQLTDADYMWSLAGINKRLSYDSSLNETSLGVLYGIETQKLIANDDLGNGQLFVEGAADIVLRNTNTDMNVIGGPLYPRYSEFVIEGTTLGQNVSIFSETFESGTMNQFSNNFWIAIDSPDCPFHLTSGGTFCAENSGISPVESDVAEFSSIGFEILNLTIDVVADLDGPATNDGVFQLYMDNNEGDNALIIEIDGLDLTEQTLSNLTIPATMDNKTMINISIEYDGESLLNQINIDNIIITATAIEDTSVNVSRSRSHVKMLDGDGDCDIFAYDVEGTQNMNITCDEINFVGNVTQASVTEIELNITESLFVGENVTIGGWFNGLFNWNTLTNWLSFNGSTLSFNETKLNDTIDDRQVNESILQGANSTGGINTLSMSDDNVLQLSVVSQNTDSEWWNSGGTLTPQTSNLNVTTGDRYFLPNGASIGYNSTCDIIKWDSAGSVISYEGCS